MADPNKPHVESYALSAVGITIASSSISAETSLLPIASWQVQPLPPDHAAFTMIGRVAAAWSELEHTLDLIIWSLAHIDLKRGACVTAQIMGAVPRFRAIITLLNHLDTESARKLAGDFNALMQKTYDVSEARNRIVHDAWYLYTTTGEPAQFKAMPFKNPKYGINPVDMKELESTIRKIERRQASVSKLRDEVTALLKA